MGCSPWGRKESDTTEQLHFHFSLSCFGEGNGNPLPCSCLQNPRDGGAWWATVYGVAQSQTRLKRLSSSKFPDGSGGKESAFIAGHMGSIPGWGRSPGEGNVCLFQYSCLENSMDRGDWQTTGSWGHKKLDTTEQVTISSAQCQKGNIQVGNGRCQCVQTVKQKNRKRRQLKGRFLVLTLLMSGHPLCFVHCVV